MRSPQKNNRPRGKGNRKSSGAALNRVYESSGPEGKVRGTPQQIIDKYQALARDKTMSGDRVMAENLLQHAEHYVRILTAAQQRREEEEAEAAQREAQRAERNSGGEGMPVFEGDEDAEGAAQPDNLSHGHGRRRDESEGDGEEGRRRPRRSRGRARNRDDAEAEPNAAASAEEAPQAVSEAPEGLAVIDTHRDDDAPAEEWANPSERSAAV
ncbi:MAG: DUF4167 domain-containing protein [Pseudomonadota bacterium]